MYVCMYVCILLILSPSNTWRSILMVKEALVLWLCAKWHLGYEKSKGIKYE